MISYETLDKKYSGLLFKQGIFMQRILSMFFGLLYFITDRKYNNSIVISRYYKSKSFLYKLILTIKTYYYEVFFILNYGWLLFADSKSIKKFQKGMRVKNIDYLNTKIVKDRPLIVFTAHIGCFFVQLMSIMDSLKDRKVICLAPKTGQKRKEMIENFFSKFFSIDFEIVDIESKTCGIKIVKTMKNNGVILCTMDYAYEYTKTLCVKFLDKIVRRPVGIIEIGLKYDAQVLPAFGYWGNGNYNIELLEPFRLSETSGEDQVAANLGKVCKVIEDKVLETPAQWTMWKSIW